MRAAEERCVEVWKISEQFLSAAAHYNHRLFRNWNREESRYCPVNRFIRRLGIPDSGICGSVQLEDRARLQRVRVDSCVVLRLELNARLSEMRKSVRLFLRNEAVFCTVCGRVSNHGTERDLALRIQRKTD